MRRKVSVAVLAASLAALASPAFADAAAGEDVFKKCKACHMAGPDATNKVGPQLNGLIGRKVGTAEGYAYSDANKAFAEKGAVWTEEELFKYLADPKAYMPGTKMAFVGLPDEQDRKDVIEYLKQFK